MEATMASKTAAKKGAKRASRAGAASKHAAGRKHQPNGGAHGQGGAQVTIRHYCQGIGDCHLLKFTRDDGSPYWMMIDCGVHTSVKGGSATVGKIVDDLLKVTGGRLDVIVGTHEHADHFSGFSTAEEKFAEFGKKNGVGEIWLAWTEDPHDTQAQELDKYKDHALTALDRTRNALDGATGHLGLVRQGLKPLLDFQFGAKGDRVREMRDNLVKLAPKNVRYFEPKDQPITIPGLSNLRIYVLGPPRDPALIKVVERKSEMYGLAGAAFLTAEAMYNAFRVADGELDVANDYAAPFDGNVGLELNKVTAPDGPQVASDVEGFADLVTKRYFGPAEAWRRIDQDWMAVGAGLGMQLDAKTNNTSLVLAFEFIDSGRVMLFTGDAQVGNWLGWQSLTWKVDGKTVTGPDLLARTVYYKVGHHGSENATLKQKGLELMKQADFSAFIPTNEKDAKNVGWGAMPFDSILDDLEKHASGRVIRADDKWIADDKVDPRFAKPSGSILRVQHQPGLWVELDIA
jgi:hypothetical protein